MDEDDDYIDPITSAILSRIDFDLARGAAVPFTQELFDAINELVRDVEVDLDAPIEGEIVDLSVDFPSLKSNDGR